MRRRAERGEEERPTQQRVIFLLPPASLAGELKQKLANHAGPLFALRWSPSNKYLLTSSVDQTAIVWDLATGIAKQTFVFHRGACRESATRKRGLFSHQTLSIAAGPCVDVSWRTDTCFASCSTDKTVIVCEVGRDEPVIVFEGHEDEVNFIRWDPTGHYLASCSDDCTAKVGVWVGFEVACWR